MCFPVQVEVIKKAYLQGEVEFEDTNEEDDNGEEEEHDAASPRNVGHNIYILAHQVCCSSHASISHPSSISMQECDETWILLVWAFLSHALPLVCSFVQLARHNKELSLMLKPGATSGEGDEALEFYAKHTAQIEVIKFNSCPRV